MPRKTRVNAVLGAAAMATGAIGVITGAAPTVAHADPCAQWRFDGDTELVQDNGWTLTFTSTDSSVKEVHAVALPTSHNDVMSGDMDGGIYGDRVHVRFNFIYSEKSDGYTYPAFGQYDGVVDADGFAHGISNAWRANDRFPITTNESYETYMSSTNNALWTSSKPMQCADAPPDSDVLKPAGVIVDSPVFG